MEVYYFIIQFLLNIVLPYYLLAIAYHSFIGDFAPSSEGRTSSKTIMVVFGSGGHTTEMLLMLKNLKFENYSRVIFVIGHSDTWSLTKIKDFFLKNRKLDIEKEVRNLEWVRLFRSREVKQSYATSVFTTLLGLLHSFRVILQIRPYIIVTNGPGTAVPLCYASFAIGKLLLLKPKNKILFIESFCRVKSLSLSGKLLKPIANKFIIHWEELKKVHKGAILYEDKII